MCARSQRIARMRKRHLDRENVDGSVEAWEPPSFKIVWGPVSEECAVRFGAISGCESILIRPTMTLELEGILQRIRALMPDAMFPRECDDANSLARRLGDCDFLDDIHCRKGGTGRRYIRLNNTTYAQPRRVTWSELVPHELVPQEFAGEEDDTWCLFAYTQAYRHPEDWRCRPMPSPVQDLKHYVWQAAKATGRLSDYCAQHAPTACQLMIYYVLLGNRIGRLCSVVSSSSMSLHCEQSLSEAASMSSKSSNMPNSSASPLYSHSLEATFEGSTSMSFSSVTIRLRTSNSRRSSALPGLMTSLDGGLLAASCTCLGVKPGQTG